MLIAHKRLFATLGLAVIAVWAVRAARQTVVPLWAAHIGLSATQNSIIFGIASAVYMAMFYPSGKVMDSMRTDVVSPARDGDPGRLDDATPADPWCGHVDPGGHGHELRQRHRIRIMMTLGADAAPTADRIKFLSIWRAMSDSGNACGPVVVSARIT